MKQAIRSKPTAWGKLARLALLGTVASVAIVATAIVAPLALGLLLGLPLWLFWSWIAPIYFPMMPVPTYLHFVGIVAFVLVLRGILFGKRSGK